MCYMTTSERDYITYPLLLFPDREVKVDHKFLTRHITDQHREGWFVFCRYVIACPDFYMGCGIPANLCVCWAGILLEKNWSYSLPFYTYLSFCFCIYSFHIEASCAPPLSCQSLSSLLGFICRPPQCLGCRGISLAAPITQTQNLPVASSEKI